MSSELERLQHLSLVSKVCQELDDHIGLSDATLAEFIIHLAKEHSTPESFANAVRENGADFGDSFAASLLETIHSMLPSKQGSAPTKTSNKPVIDPNDPKANLVAAFPGLAAPNKAQQFDDLDFKEIDYQEMKKYKEEKKSQQPRREDRDAADGRRGRGHRERSSRRDRGDSEEREEPLAQPPFTASTEPELYHIYDGKVSKIMDFGCFVEVLPFKREGLVHIGQIQSGRLMHPRDAVGRGDIVKVK
ncbi:prp22, partial [Symbiodinium sp. KB8]